MNIDGLMPREILPAMKATAAEEKINKFVFTGKIAFLTFRNGTTVIGLILNNGRSGNTREKTNVYHPTIIVRGELALKVVTNFKRYDRVCVKGSCAVSVTRSEGRITTSARFELEEIEAYAQNGSEDTNIIAFKAPVSRISHPQTARGTMSVVSLDLTGEDGRKLYPKILCFANVSDFIRSQVKAGDTIGMRCSVYTKETEINGEKRIIQSLSCDEVTKIEGQPTDVYEDNLSQ